MDIIDALTEYAVRHHLIKKTDDTYCKNFICQIIGQESPLGLPPSPNPSCDHIDEILAPILQHAVDNGMLNSTHPDYADLMDSAIMGVLLSKPSRIQEKFETCLENEGPDAALGYLYQLSIASNYVRMNRIKKNFGWTSATPCGNLEITINLSKPEKDPKAIALAKIQEEKEVKYPSCMLCKENVGFAGNFSHPARQNLRIIQMQLGGEDWYFQFSPYIYYNEHSIVFSSEHRPMEISRKTFERMLEFLDKFPSYFIGSNADLPIVGGSILTHDHYQCGRHTFPLDRAEIIETQNPAEIDVEFSLLRWPISVVRLQSKNKHALLQAAERLFNYWHAYSNEALNIVAASTEQHNTVTPIARFSGDSYQLDLALRNNRVSEKHPLGIFHPHAERHHIKKENIGLIEVMGLAILPGRLMEELALVKKHLVEKSLKAAESAASLTKHLPWMKELAKKHAFTEDNASALIQDETAQVFYDVLSDCGVFKNEKDFSAFLKDFLENF